MSINVIINGRKERGKGNDNYLDNEILRFRNVGFKVIKLL